MRHEEQRHVLRAPMWRTALQMGLGGAPLTTCHDDHSIDWTVFKRWSIRASYANFPVGFESDLEISPFFDKHLEQLSGAGVDLVMASMPASLALQPQGHCPIARLLETRISNLESWGQHRLASSTRRKLNRAKRLGFFVRDARPEDHETVAALYRESVTRKAGRIRYGTLYFRELCDIACRSAAFSIGMVCDATEEVVGFIALAHSDSKSYYLHGGFSSRAASGRPGFLAMEWGIERCKALGCTEVNLLTSPARQTELERFKESFGGTSTVRLHYRIPCSTKGRVVNRCLAILTRARG